MSPRKKIIYQSIFGQDILFQFLTKKKWITPWTIAVIVFLVGAIDELVLGWYLGYWNSSSGVVGVLDLNNVPPLIMSLLVEPGVWAFYVGFPEATKNLFEKISNNGILLSERDKFISRVERVIRFESSWTLRILALGAAIVLSIYATNVISIYNPVPWFYYERLHYYLIGFPRILASSYVVTYSVVWSAMALYAIHRTFRTSRVRVMPYHEDNAGGLRFIGDFILSISRLTWVVLLFLIGETLFAVRMGRGLVGQVNLLLELIALPTLLSLMILIPLLACRKSMKNARLDFLAQFRDKIAEQIETIKNPNAVMSAAIQNANGLIDFQLRLRKEFPTWPFDTTMARQFGIGFLASFLPVLSFVLEFRNLFMP